MLLSRFGGFQLLAICIAHFTGATGVSRPENVDRADPIDVHRGIFADVCSDAQAALVNSLKGVSSRLLHQQRPDIRKRYWKGVL